MSDYPEDYFDSEEAKAIDSYQHYMSIKAEHLEQEYKSRCIDKRSNASVALQMAAIAREDEIDGPLLD